MTQASSHSVRQCAVSDGQFNLLPVLNITIDPNFIGESPQVNISLLDAVDYFLLSVKDGHRTLEPAPVVFFKNTCDGQSVTGCKILYT